MNETESNSLEANTKLTKLITVLAGIALLSIGAVFFMARQGFKEYRTELKSVSQRVPMHTLEIEGLKLRFDALETRFNKFETSLDSLNSGQQIILRWVEVQKDREKRNQ